MPAPEHLHSWLNDETLDGTLLDIELGSRVLLDLDMNGPAQARDAFAELWWEWEQIFGADFVDFCFRHNYTPYTAPEHMTFAHIVEMPEPASQS